MPWVEARFKEQKVWAEVDAEGRLLAQDGRVPIRYNPKEGATIYRAGASTVVSGGGALKELPPGALADDAKPSGAAAGKGGKGAKRGSGFGKAGTRTAAQASAAKVAAGELIAGFSADAAVCFTDGACKGNPGPAGSGAVVRLPGGEVRERYAALGHKTNNVGELTAVLLALDLLDEAGIASEVAVEILTDSQYCVGVLVQGWKAKVSEQLIKDIKARLAKRKARLHWIAGHVGVDENERADALANMGVAESARAGR